MHRLRTWRGLTPVQRRLVLRAWLAFPPLVIALRWKGYRAVHGAMVRVASAPASLEPAPAAAMAQDVSRAVEIAARYSLLRTKCLSRSMMLWWLLRRRGIAAELRIGVRKRDGLFEAHAWVEYQGAVVNDRPDIATRFASFDGDMAAMSLFRS